MFAYWWLIVTWPLSLTVSQVEDHPRLLWISDQEDLSSAHWNDLDVYLDELTYRSI